MNKFFIIIAALFIGFSSFSQRKYMKPKFAENWSKPSKHPDHIVLNISNDPATSISVTWRTSREVSQAYGEIAISHENPKFTNQAITKKAITNTLRLISRLDKNDEINELIELVQEINFIRNEVIIKELCELPALDISPSFIGDILTELKKIDFSVLKEIDADKINEEKNKMFHIALMKIL